MVWLLLLPDGEGPDVLLLKMPGDEAGVADVRVHPSRQDAHRVLTQPGHLEQGHCVHKQTRVHPHLVIRSNRVHTVWQRPLFGLHSIMMEKFGQDGGVASPPPFTVSSTITYKVVVYAS